MASGARPKWAVSGGNKLLSVCARVHQFKMNEQLTLLGYSFDDGALVLELMVLGSHENFYHDLKR
ncbi:hypothetical protein E0L35_15995 [Halomonas sp. ATBC28]|nr:hypothetical protein [Halomonas sp. MG34]NVE91411.1 type II toxin-antitoxin system RelE/ParE family toxin [Halomonas titanicae]PKH62436.1 hypothetical protein CXF94_06455 [Halomonas sp. Choline-3u-9]QGQ71971.1 hypothetical protein FDY98_21380 [Halomonas sp. PA16-9]TMU22964.1 hypothetical protein E0L35_15995 [Halomonas sp. ATBC28]